MGRVDAELELADKVYVMEFKYEKAEDGKSVDELLAKGVADSFKQINEKDYARAYIGGGMTVYKTAVAVAGRGKVRVLHEKVE